MDDLFSDAFEFVGEVLLDRGSNGLSEFARWAGLVCLLGSLGSFIWGRDGWGMGLLGICIFMLLVRVITEVKNLKAKRRIGG